MQFGDVRYGGSRGEIRHQPLAPRRVFTQHHGDVAHTVAQRQPRLDLTQFDAEPTQLDLLVGPAQVAQGAVALPADQVATAVHARGRVAAEGVGAETLGGELGLAQVAQGHAVAAQVQLAHRPYRQRLLMGIKHIAAAVADRFADRNAAAIDCGYGVGGAERGRFGRPVAIEQMCRGAALQHTLHHLRVQHITAHHQVTQLGKGWQQGIGELMEQASGEPQHADGLLYEYIAQRLARQHLILVHHHNGTPVEQRRPHFQGAGIERRVGGEGHPILGVEGGEAVVDHQAGNGLVRHQHTFGRTRGAGGIHDIGRALCTDGDAWGVCRVARQRAAVQLDAHGAGHLRLAGQGEQYPGAAVADHIGLALDGCVVVQRHIHRTAGAGGQLRGQQVEPTWQQQGHRIARHHTQAKQVMGQLIHVLLQLAVGPLLLAVNHRAGLGCTGGLGREQLVHRLCGWVIAGGGVEVLQHLLTVACAQLPQLPQRCAGRVVQRLGQLRQGKAEQVADLCAVDLWHGLYGKGEAVAGVVHVDHKRVIAALDGRDLLDAAPGVAERGLGRCTVADVQQAGEQCLPRRNTAAALGQCQRGLLVGQQPGQALVGQAHAVGHCCPTCADAQRQGVDEHTQRPFGPCTALQAAQQHRAEHHFFAPAQLRQYLCPGLMHQARDTDAQLPGLRAQLRRYLRLQRMARFQHLAGTGQGIREAEHHRRFVDIPQQLAEQRFVRCRVRAQPCLGHVVAVRHAGKCQRLVLQHGSDFSHQLLDGGVVQQDVVDQQGCLQPRVALLGHQPQQRRLVQVQPLVCLSAAVCGLQCRHLAPYHLYRLFQRVPVNAGTQHVMPGDDLVKCCGESVQLGLGREAETGLQHVGVHALAGQVVVQNALLQGRQAINVLNVRDAARDLPDHAVDSGLRKAGQWQQRRGDAGAARYDAVGRHHHGTLAAQRSCQGRQRWLAEQHPDVGLQAPLAQACSKGHGQQRVAAQFEEVVVTPYPFHAQQFAPECRQQGFGIALGRFIRAISHGARFWQGLAVQLAIGAQRQCLQVHELRRHHEFRQVQQQGTPQVIDRLRLTRVVRDQALIAGDDHRFVDALDAGQPRLDLTQFDTQAAQLHLVVVAAQVFQVAIRQVPCKVAGAVQACTGLRAERVIDEAFSGELQPVQVAPRHLDTADVQLPGDAVWYRLPLFVQHVQRGVGDGCADWGIIRGRHTVPGADVYRCFGRAVQVVQFYLRQLRVEPPYQAARQRFTAAHHAFQPRGLPACGKRRQEHFQHRRHEVQRADALLLDGVLQVLRITMPARARHHQLRTRLQWPQQFPHGHVEAERCFLQNHVLGTQAVRILHPQQAVDHGAVFVHHAFGQAGRA